MRTAMKISIFLAVTGEMAMLAGNAQGADKELISVAISPAVQEQIQKLNPRERKRLEAAIGTGNRFVPHHFDLTAYARNDEQEEKIWLKNIRPLVNRDSADWYNPGGVFADGAPELEINGNKVTFEVVCPLPELVSAYAVNDHFELTYRTKIIGMWKTNSKMSLTEGDILLEEKEKYDEVLITLDKNNRVGRVASKYAVLPTIPKIGIHMFESYIKWPPRSIFQGAHGVDQESESEAKAKIPQYKKYIELIKSEETAVCKGDSSSYK